MIHEGAQLQAAHATPALQQLLETVLQQASLLALTLYSGLTKQTLGAEHGANDHYCWFCLSDLECAALAAA